MAGLLIDFFDKNFLFRGRSIGKTQLYVNEKEAQDVVVGMVSGGDDVSRYSSH